MRRLNLRFAQSGFVKCRGTHATGKAKPRNFCYSSSSTTPIDYLDNLRSVGTKQGIHTMASIRKHLQKHGFVHLPGFVARDVAERMAQECLQLEQSGGAFLSTEVHTVYQEEHDPAFADDHPRNAMQESSKLILDYAKVPLASPLRSLYAREDLRRFVQSIVLAYLPEDELHLSDCAYNSAYYNIYRSGHGLGWHFDRSAFGVNLVLKTPTCVDGGAGGIFEWCAHTRASQKGGDPWEFGKVGAIIRGEKDSQVVTQVDELAPGSLVIFAGVESLHHVTPVRSSLYLNSSAPSLSRDPTDLNRTIERINAILTYETAPGQRMNAYGLKKFFGREDAR